MCSADNGMYDDFLL